jgi:dehydrogenase/reductase SDR family member 7B
MSFQDQVVWITGASGGIGEAIALELSRQGARLILSARREDELARVKAACAATVAVLPLDITDFDGMDAKVATAIGLHGHVDILVNNAGVGMWSKAEKTSLETDRRIMDVDFFGPVALSKALLPHLLERGAGRIAGSCASCSPWTGPSSRRCSACSNGRCSPGSGCGGDGLASVTVGLGP